MHGWLAVFDLLSPVLHLGKQSQRTSCVSIQFPLTDDVLKHVKFVDFEKRESSEFSDVEYFIGRYRKILDMNFDDIFDEFVAFQLLASSDIPQFVWESAKEKMENDYQEFVRMDEIWAFFSTMKLVMVAI